MKTFHPFTARFAPLLLLCTLAPLRETFAAAHPSLPPPVVPECLGVNIHFTDPKPGEMEMLAGAGFKWVRMDLTWAGTERKAGEYDFSAYDRLVAALDKHKLRAVFILDYGNPLYAAPGDKHPFTSRAGTPEFRDAFAKWAVAAVSHFKGRGTLWEMWNEPNHEGFWKPKANVDDYAVLAKATGEALRGAGLVGVPPSGGGEAAASPDSLKAGLQRECFIGPATSTIDLPFLEACFKAGLLDYWDAVSVHPYRQTAPESVEEEYRSLRLLIRRYAPAGKDIPIISGEWGYSTQYPAFAGKDAAARDEQQAKWLARQFLTNLGNDVALSIWYDWHDDGTDPKEAEHHFGVVRHEYHPGRDPVYDPKPAYTAMKTLTEQLGGLAFNKLISDWPSSYGPRWHLLFADGDRERLAAWTSHVWPVSLNCSLEQGALERWGYLGKPEARVAADAKVPTVHLEAAPSYFVPVKSGPVWELAAAWERAPQEITLASPGTVAFKTRFRNPLRKPVAVMTWCSIDGRWAEGDIVYSIRMLKPETAVKPEESIELFADMKVTGREAPKRVELWAGFWIGDNLIEEVCQPVRLIITNPLTVKTLPLEAEALPIVISDPSRKGFSGSFWLRGGTPKPPTRQIFKIPAGETEVVVRISAAELAEIVAADPIEVYARIDADDSSPVFDRPIRLPRRSPPELLQTASAVVDGNPDTEGAARLAPASSDAEIPNRETPVVKLDYSMAAGWKFARLSAGEGSGRKIDGHPWEFGLWIRGDGKGCRAHIRFKDSTGQVFQPDGPKIDWKGWRYVTFPMQTTVEKLAHWGGENDGLIHYPIEWDSIFLLDNVSRQPVEGEIYLSAPTLIY